MIGRIRPRLTYANVTATLALVFALAGGAYAAAKITGADVRNESLTGADVHSLTDADFKGGNLLSAPGTTRTVQADSTVGSDGTGGQVATCPASMVVTGGGFTAGNTDALVRDSQPAGNNAWVVFVEQGTPGTQFSVWAVCSD